MLSALQICNAQIKTAHVKEMASKKKRLTYEQQQKVFPCQHCTSSFARTLQVDAEDGYKSTCEHLI